MTNETEYAHVQGQAQAHADPAMQDSELAPGHGNRAAQLVAPAHPLVSGLIRRKPRDAGGVADGAEHAVALAASSGSHPLPETVASRFESSLGSDLSSVRVHTGAASQAAAASVGARAYTVGQDIHFAAGQYDPSSAAGQHLLAHEVAHTVQQLGASPTRQNKLEVSNPHDGFEQEADRAADAMVSGAAFAIGRGALGVSRKPAEDSMGEKMADEASYEEAKLRSEAPPTISQVTSVQTLADVAKSKRQISDALSNLALRKDSQTQALADVGSSYQGRETAQKAISETEKYIAENGRTEATLSEIENLESGNSNLDDRNAHKPGHAMRLQAFNGLFTTCKIDFARLQGVVNAFLGAHPNVDSKAGTDGGADLGRAVVSGGKATDPNKATEKLAAPGDAETRDALAELKAAKTAYEGANYDQQINDQMGQCSSATGKVKNELANQRFGTVRPDTDAQKQAKGEVAEVEADLAAAKAAIAKVEAVVELATAAMGAPELGVLGEGSALTATSDAVKAGVDSKVKSLSPENTRRLEAAQRVPGGAKQVAKTADIDIDIAGAIKQKVAEGMTNYNARISAARAKVDKANEDARKALTAFDEAKLRNATGDVTAAFDALGKIVKAMAAAKKQLRDSANKVVEAQKKHRKPGQPDLGAISKALAETTAFVETAKAAITQGDAEQQVAAEMMDKRRELAGDFKATDGRTKEFATGATKTAVAEKAGVIVDCAPTEPFAITRKPLSFSQWQGRGSDGREASTETVDQNTAVVKTNLDALKEYKATAEGFKQPLERALFGS